MELMRLRADSICDTTSHRSRGRPAKTVACPLCRLSDIDDPMNGRRYRIEYGHSALDDLDRLPPRVRAQVLRKIERLEHGLHGNIKRLHENRGIVSVARGRLQNLV